MSGWVFQAGQDLRAASDILTKRIPLVGLSLDDDKLIVAEEIEDVDTHVMERVEEIP